MTIEIRAKCDNCDQICTCEADTNILCSDCVEGTTAFDISAPKAAIHYALGHDSTWTQPEYYRAFSNKDDKETFSRGAKHGFLNALFWIADYFGEIEFWQELEKTIK